MLFSITIHGQMPRGAGCLSLCAIGISPATCVCVCVCVWVMCHHSRRTGAEGSS